MAEEEKQTSNEEKPALEAEELKQGDIGVYEIGYLLLPSIPEGEVAGEVQALHALIEKEGGRVFDEGFPVLRDLAYAMNKVRAGRRDSYDKAYFGWVKIELSPEKVREVSDQIKARETILRHLLFKTVRESTLAPKKFSTLTRPGDDRPAAPKMTEEEIEKAVQELVVE